MKVDNDNLNLSQVDTIGKLPLSEQVYCVLKKAIIDGILKPDMKLSEVKVAEQLSVSPTPVREAFRKLAMDNLVSIVPWKGVRVKGFSPAEIVAMYQIREVIEGLGAKLAAEKMDSSTKTELRSIYDQALKTRDSQEMVELNSLFHLIINEASGNSKIPALLETCKEMINHDMFLTSYDEKRALACQQEHFEILEAICSGNPEQAETKMRRHIYNAFMYKKMRANM